LEESLPVLRRTFFLYLLIFLLAPRGRGTPSVPGHAGNVGNVGSVGNVAGAESTRQAFVGRAVQLEVERARRQSAAMGVHVVDLASGGTVYAYDADAPRVVASNTKLFTTAAALDAFGPGFFFETPLLLRGSVRGGVLAGDLGVVGGGDPNISGRQYDGDPYAIFRGWAVTLKARGILRVSGDLYLDSGLFEPLLVHPHWPRGQLGSWYEAPVGALSFNDNCILVRVSPGRAGGAARVETVPNLPLFEVDNAARTVAGRRRGTHLAIARQGTLLTVRGAIAADAGEFDTWVTVPDPAVYFGAALRAALASEGVRLDGRLRPVERLPGTVWERVAVYRSDLVTTIDVTNKRSQNFYAESLAKQLGARRCGEGSWRAGVRAIREFAEGLGIPRGSFTLEDGSGMSRENRFAPRSVTTLLRHMYFHAAGPEYLQSLPFAGEDNGSWKRRLAASPYRGNVFAKTGTLEGVSALSGYAKAVSGRVYTFSILLNQARGDSRHAEDRIVMALIENG
jgi:serine-type D-Ala-D-Ala carboxypeptidase/endopeptidase (penicillin-binding protein 4)